VATQVISYNPRSMDRLCISQLAAVGVLIEAMRQTEITNKADEILKAAGDNTQHSGVAEGGCVARGVCQSG